MSSANRKGIKDRIHSGRLLIKMTNNSGPRALTPESTLQKSEKQSPILTH